MPLVPLDVRIVLSGLWVATMLIYLLGDVLRLFAGDMTPGEIDGVPANPLMWIAAALIMLIPIAMVVLALVLPHGANRWTNILAALFLLVFNLVAIRGYPGAYDRLLLAISLIPNLTVATLAWNWQ